MMYEEFTARLLENTRRPTDKEFETISFVYANHPAIHPSNGKDQIALLYNSFGMRIICDMLETAKRVQEIEDERRHLRLRLEELETEQQELAMI